jgi:Ni/Fe-hydrogenase subunit HybB-like protein
MRLQISVHPRILRLRPSPLAILLGVLMAIGFVVAMVRFASGIGAISNLNNVYPWGFWISFDLFTGVAISSGAFVMAAIVYIFEWKEFKPLLRPTVLTGFLGYLMVIIALLVDLGRPERIWHMMIYWNHTSVLLEIGICVMSYTTVLAIEFAPVLFEGLRWQKMAQALHRWIMPFVILGVVLSTLHQSSLGSLLLIQPEKLHPLWWTPILPILFFISAVGMGLAMIIIESTLSSRYFHRGLETHLLRKLAGAVPLVLGVYLIVRFAELALAGDLKYLFSSGVYSVLFWVEVALGSLVPIVLFSSASRRGSPKWLWIGATSLLLGMILNRFDVSWLAVHRLTQVSYLPSLPELSISIAIFSFGTVVFGLAARYLPVFDNEAQARPGI